ncbi:MAG: hypothetical protein EPN56_14490 [Rhodanobacter sp.]|nr:MAG: hypothetical protein EPN78_04930 [Rhodanobacter sp.]TAM15247.1 MAG: hypothetical protein EPN66_00040 [Rhodanobacter sp.]TAM34306.1 MAG: hypothetical protein EPN56_14490 [Rhodanobacter sp.]
MRKLVLSLLSMAVLALAGCGSSSSTAEGGAAGVGSAAAAASSVSGTISVRGAIQPSPNAQLTINLVDASAGQGGAAPLASKTVDGGVTFPYAFELNFKPADIKSADLYVVRAILTDGNRHYSMPMQAPVLTNGNANQTKIELQADPTPAEKDLAAFKSLVKQIGGMKVTSGTKLDADASRSWQVFRDNGQVKMIRELVDYGDKGFTSTDFAYNNGAPWVAEQKKKASQNAAPSQIERASWTQNGMLVLHEQQSGSDVGDLGSDAAATLLRQAKAIYNLAGGNKK